MGILFIILGGWLFSIMRGAPEIPSIIYVYPVIVVIVGISLIALNYSEERIEQRKDLIRKKYRK